MSGTDTEDARRVLEDIAERRRQVDAAAAAPLPWWYLLGTATGLCTIGAGQDFHNSAAFIGGGLVLFISTNTCLQQSRGVQPHPHTIAGAAMAVAFVVLAVWTQRVARNRLQADRR